MKIFFLFILFINTEFMEYLFSSYRANTKKDWAVDLIALPLGNLNSNKSAQTYMALTHQRW